MNARSCAVAAYARPAAIRTGRFREWRQHRLRLPLLPELTDATPRTLATSRRSPQEMAGRIKTFVGAGAVSRRKKPRTSFRWRAAVSGACDGRLPEGEVCGGNAHIENGYVDPGQIPARALVHTLKRRGRWI